MSAAGPGDAVSGASAVPMLGEPLPIELANTTYAVRGRLREGLHDVAQLTFWLEQMRPRLALPAVFAADASDLAAARELRDAIRALAGAAVEGGRPAAADVDTVNRLTRRGPRWRELSWDTTPTSTTHSSAPAVAAALAGIAQEAVDLFAGPALADLRACHAPGCVLFFVKDHPRREWCSAGCGNRMRAARHYERTRGR